MDLTQQTCVPYEGGVPALSHEQALELLRDVPGWSLSADGTHISNEYVLPNFARALAFVNAVGALAEEEGHHPDMHLTNYKQVRIELTTHAIGGLSTNDFILAAKIGILSPKVLDRD